MNNASNRLHMVYIAIGFLFIVAAIFIVNRFMAQGISETEKQIQHFQIQAGIKQQQLKTLSIKSEASQETGESTSKETAQPVESTMVQPEVRGDIIYEPPLDSTILVQ